MRSGQFAEKKKGVVVSLSSGSIDIVVATPPKAQFLQQNGEARYVFRVYEKFVWRVKDPSVVAPLYQ